MSHARTGLLLDGSRVGRARGELDLTQIALASRCDISRITLNRIENGKQRVSLETVERLAQELGRSREWLQGLPETIDPVEQARARVAKALDMLGQGFEDLNDALAAQIVLATSTRQKAAT